MRFTTPTPRERSRGFRRRVHHRVDRHGRVAASEHLQSSGGARGSVASSSTRSRERRHHGV